MTWRLRSLEPAVVLLVIGLAYFPGLDNLPFHPDESCKIGYSAPFEAMVSGRFTDALWQQREDKYLNPVLTYYVIGAARRLGGYGADALNRPWDFSVPDEQNVRHGRVPAPGLLWWGRAGVTAAACVGVFVIFTLIRRAGPAWIAWVWLGLALTSPYLRVELRRSLNEGVLVAVLALAMWALYRMLCRADTVDGAGSSGPVMRWVAVVGAAAGLAAQTKLNGGMAAVGAAGVLVLASVRWRAPWRQAMRTLLARIALLAAASAFAFVGSNPSLWSDPPREMARMLRERVHVMHAQAARFPDDVIDGGADRLRVVPARIFGTHLTPLGVLPNLVLFMAGTGASLVALSRWTRARDSNHARTVLTLVGAAAAAPMLFTPLDWARYYVLPVIFASVQIVFGAEWLLRRIVARVGRTRVSSGGQSCGGHVG